MIGGKKIDNKHGIVVDGNVDRAILINGNVILEQHIEQTVEQHVNVIAETLTRQANAAPRYLAWEDTEARYDTFGTLTLTGDGDQQPTHSVLIDWLQEQNSPPVFLLLGEYGMGKTLECQRLYCYLRDAAALNAPPDWARRAIYLDLRRLPQFTHAERSGTTPLPSAPALIENLIKTDWAEVEGARHPGYEEIKGWLSEGALLIVDGLDECLVHLLERQHQSFLAIWIDLLWDATQRAQKSQRRLPRLLLSCRSEFFKNQENQQTFFRSIDKFKRLMPGRDKCATYRQFVLQPLTEDRIYRYIEDIAPGIEPTIARELIESTHNLAELSRRPITLSFIAENLSELLAASEHMSAINAAGLYELVVRHELGKNSGKHHLSSEHKYKLLTDFAAYIWRQGVRRVPHSVLHAWLHDWLEVLCRDDSRAKRDYAGMNSERIEEDIRTASLLTRSIDSGDSATAAAQENRIESEGFGFAHSSYADYFLAVYLAEAVRADRPHDWAMVIPSNETLAFLAQRLELDQAVLMPQERDAGGLPTTLTRWIKTYRAQTSELLLEYALSLRNEHLCAPVFPNLRGADLRGAKLRGWNFGDRFQDEATPLLDLSRICWAGADLRDSYFAHVRLDYGDFTGARLDVAAFQHCSAQRCDWRGSDLVGTVFRHCRLERGIWDPLRRLHRPKKVCSAGAESFAVALSPPEELQKNETNLVFQQKLSQCLSITLDTQKSKELILRISAIHHWGQAFSIATTSDGKRMLTGSEDGIVRVWDLESRECIKEIRGHKGAIHRVAVSDDCRFALSYSSYDWKSIVWDLESGQIAGNKVGSWLDSGSVLSKKGNLAVDISMSISNSTVSVSDALNGRYVLLIEAQQWQTGEVATGNRLRITKAALSADGNRLFVRFSNSIMHLWDLGVKQLLWREQGTANAIAAMSTSGARVAEGSEDGEIRVWNILCDEPALRLRSGSNRSSAQIRCLSFSFDERLLLSGHDDGLIRVWCLDEKRLIQEFRASFGKIYQAEFINEGSAIIATAGSCFLAFDVLSGEKLWGLGSHATSIRGCVFRFDRDHIIAYRHYGNVLTFDVSSGRCVDSFLSNDDLEGLAISDNGRYLVSSVFMGDRFCVWDIEASRVVGDIAVRVFCAAISSDASIAITCQYNGKIRVWDVRSGKCLKEFKPSILEEAIVAISQDGKRAIFYLSCDTDHHRYYGLWVWNWVTAEPYEVQEDHGGGITSLALSDDGNLALVGTYYGHVYVLDMSSGKSIRIVEPSSRYDYPCSLKLSSDGKLLVSGSKNGVIRLWDMDSDRLVAEGRGHTLPVNSIAFSKDASCLVSTSIDRTIRCWSLTDEKRLMCLWVAMVGSPYDVFSQASWRPGQNGESDELLSASGDAWRFLSWDVEDPVAPGGGPRLPLQGYE